MRQEQLPSPGIHRNGQRLRVEAAKAISLVEILVTRTSSTDAQSDLQAFFQACVEAIPGYTAPTCPTLEDLLSNTQAVVSNGDALTFGGVTFTITVAGGEVTLIEHDEELAPEPEPDPDSEA